MFAPMKVSSHFDGGNIEIVDITRPGDAHLQIRRDSHSEFLQWFNFRVSEVRDLALTLHTMPQFDGYYSGNVYGDDLHLAVGVLYDIPNDAQVAYGEYRNFRVENRIE